MVRFYKLNKSLIILFLIFIFRLSALCSIFSPLEFSLIKSCISSRNENFILEEVAQSDNFNSIRKELSYRAKDYLSSEQSALVMGLVLGLNELYYYPEFRNALISTGTIHVVVASGFNVSLVSNTLITVLKNKYSTKTIILVILSTFGYSLLTGFDPPIFRAWIMSMVLLLVSISGRHVNGIQVLVFSALLMLILNPMYLVSLSFQLSFMATFGLIYYGDFIKKLFSIKSSNIFVEDFVATISAQVFVSPLLLYRIGDMSLLGLIVNPLTLWIIPISTIIGFVFVASLYVDFFVSSILAVPLSILSGLFIYIIKKFGEISFLELKSIDSPLYILIWYSILIIVPKLITGHFER